MKIYNSIAVTTAIFSLYASAVLADVPPYTTTQQILNSNQANWQRQQIRDYNYQYQKFGPNPENIVYPLSFKARNDLGVYGQDGNNNQILWKGFVIPTFSDFFRVIQEQINDNARSIDVVYTTQGYPSSIKILMRNNTFYDVSLTGFVYGTNMPNRALAAAADNNTSKRGLRGNSSKQTRKLQGYDPVAMLQELGNNQALWASKAIYNYGYSFQNTGSNNNHIVYPWSVTVRNKVQATGKDGNGNEILYKNPHPQTMEEFFTRIHSALTAGVKSMTVAYNPQHGYPLAITIVYNEDVAQSTYAVHIYDFQIE